MNIYDIAAKCGVSIATVSRVLNNSPHVRAETRDRVLAVMQEEKYTPNAFARGLGAGSTKLVGILCTAMQDDTFPSAVMHMEPLLREQGLTALLCTVATEEEAAQAIGDLAQLGVAGLLVLGCPHTEAPLAAATAAGLPVVLIHGASSLAGVYSIRCDERQAIAQVVAELFGRQRRNILLLHSGDTYSNREKIAGYREGYAAAGYPANDLYIVEVEPQIDAINTCIKRLLVKGVSFDALIGTDDRLAVGAQKALQRIGLTMPVIGGHDSIVAQCATPAVTSIADRPAAVYRTAVEVFCRRLQGEGIPAQTVLPAPLVERDSFRR